MAVLDSRQLLFDRGAIRESLRADTPVAHHLKLPASDRDLIDLVPGEQCVEVTHWPPGAAEAAGPMIHRLNASQVAALLIAYCIRSRIPVPRNCKKGIVIGDTHVALTFAKRIPVGS